MFYFIDPNGKIKKFNTIDEAIETATDVWISKKKKITIEVINNESGHIAATLQSDNEF